jgi:hypothetical protein
MAIASWELEFDDGTTLGIVERDFSRVGGFSVDLMNTMEYSEERDRFVEQIGYFPPESISVCAGRKKDIDHLIASHLAAALLERYDGMLNVHGLLQPARERDLQRIIDHLGYEDAELRDSLIEEVKPSLSNFTCK